MDRDIVPFDLSLLLLQISYFAWLGSGKTTIQLVERTSAFRLTELQRSSTDSALTMFLVPGQGCITGGSVNCSSWANRRLTFFAGTASMNWLDWWLIVNGTLVDEGRRRIVVSV